MKRNKNGIIIAFSLGITVLASFFASKYPDGLDQVSEKLGFAHRAIDGPAPMSGYFVPHLGDTGLSMAVAGILGVLFCYGVFMFAAKLNARK